MQKQQGDVTLELIQELPKGIKSVKAKERGFVLMEGKATGHAHCIAETDPAICELYEKDGILYVKANKSVIIKHEEHNPMTLDPGIWKVGQVKEFDYLQNMTRAVID